MSDDRKKSRRRRVLAILVVLLLATGIGVPLRYSEYLPKRRTRVQHVDVQPVNAEATETGTASATLDDESHLFHHKYDQPFWFSTESAQIEGDWTMLDGSPFEGTNVRATLSPGKRVGHIVALTPDTFSVDESDSLIQYIFIDPDNPPHDLVIKIVIGQYTRHWIYWGESLMDQFSRDRIRLGDLPPSGAWVRLRIPGKSFQANGKFINKIRYEHYGGQVLWGPTTKSDSDDHSEVAATLDELRE
jgi:hypothetical protein